MFVRYSSKFLSPPLANIRLLGSSASGRELSTAERRILQEENRARYGLTEQYVDSLELPPKKRVRIFDNPLRAGLGTVDRLDSLYAIKR